MRHRTGLVVIALCLLVLPARAVQQPTFRSEVSYVEVTARVTNAGGTFVADLDQGDFELREEGRPQTITDFKLVDLTSGPPAPAPSGWERVDADVQSNAAPFDGRVFVFVLDSLHVRTEQVREVRVMARRFVEKYFGEGDVGAVVNTAGRADSAQEFTTSRARLLSAIDAFSAYSVGRLETDEPTVRDMVPGGPMSLASDTLSSLRSVAELLGSVRGRRKAIVFFSEGPGYCGETALQSDSAASGMASQGSRFESLTPSTVNEPKTWARGVLNDGMQRLVAAANRNNVAIYGVDPRGMSAGATDARANSGAANADGSVTSSCDYDASLRSLHDLSNQTAGFAVANTNNIDGGFERIRQDNSRYYVLGYYPAERAAEGTYRRIVVRVKRPGLQVQARQGYRVPPRPAAAAAPPKEGESSAALREAMDSVLPVSGLRLSAGAVIFRSDSPGADVIVPLLVDGRDVTFQPGGAGRLSGTLELALGTMNSRGERGVNQYELVQLPLDEGARATVVSLGIRLVRKLTLPPGRHQLRVGVLDRPTGRAGVVHVDVVVPDYKKAALNMSGVLVTSTTAGRVPTARGGPLDQLQKMLPGPPALTREFRASEELGIYAEVYGAVAGAEVSATVVDESGREARVLGPAGSPGASAAADAGGVADRRDFRRTIALRSLQPGRYVLRVEARSPASPSAVVRREVPFTVGP